MTFPRVVLWLAGLTFIGFGLAFTLWPLPMARVVEIPLPTPTARIDFAATYGGFEIGMGVFLLVCARRAAWLEAGLWATAASLAGFAFVRAFSLIFAAGPASRPIFLALALEVSGLVVTLVALRRVSLTRLSESLTRMPSSG